MGARRPGCNRRAKKLSGRSLNIDCGVQGLRAKLQHNRIGAHDANKSAS